MTRDLHNRNLHADRWHRKETDNCSRCTSVWSHTPLDPYWKEIINGKILTSKSLESAGHFKRIILPERERERERWGTALRNTSIALTAILAMAEKALRHKYWKLWGEATLAYLHTHTHTHTYIYIYILVYTYMLQSVLTNTHTHIYTRICVYVQSVLASTHTLSSEISCPLSQ